MINASIITIGDELLIGQVVDTNSPWMAQQLNTAGITVLRRVAVGDNWDEIWNALDYESTLSQIILITGGLGPTSDDITKSLLCKYFNGKMVVNETALENVKYLFEQVFRRPAIGSNLKQAEVPDVCNVIQNKRGTAPGMWFEKEGKIFISMPGVPNEMKGMMEEIIPLLKQQFQFPEIIHKTLLTSGVGESFLSQKLEGFEKELTPDIKLAYLPAYGMVRLRLSSTGFNKKELEYKMTLQFDKLIELVSEFLVTDEDEPMELVLGKLLKTRKMTMGTAESCTGGYIAHLITMHPGASAFFKGSIVGYDNEVKRAILHVNSSTLETAGAVSEDTVTQMIQGLIKSIGCTVGIAVSGIMGPDGGTEEKPVGTVWIAVGNKDNIKTQKLQLRFDRIRNIHVTTTTALDLLRKFVLNNYL